MPSFSKQYLLISRSLDQRLPQLIEPEAKRWKHFWHPSTHAMCQIVTFHFHLVRTLSAAPDFRFITHAFFFFLSNFGNGNCIHALCAHRRWHKIAAQLVFATFADDMATAPFRNIDANPIRCSKQKKLAVVAVHKRNLASKSFPFLWQLLLLLSIASKNSRPDHVI